MMEVVGRLLVREGKVAGVFLPAGNSLPMGLYEIKLIFEEIHVKHVGVPAMNPDRLGALDLEGLMVHKPEAFMTEPELEQYCEFQENKRNESLPKSKSPTTQRNRRTAKQR